MSVPPFPLRAKFAPLRQVQLEAGKPPPPIINYVELIRTFLARDPSRSDPLTACDVFFLDTEDPYAWQLAEIVKAAGKLPVGYMAAARLPDMNSQRGIAAAFDKFRSLQSKGWTHLELSFGPGSTQRFIRSLVHTAQSLNLSVALHGEPEYLCAIAPDAATVEEVRARKDSKYYSKFVSKHRPVFATEYGRPTSPGKEQIDLKTFAIRNSMSLTLLAKPQPGVPMKFHYAVAR